MLPKLLIFAIASTLIFAQEDTSPAATESCPPFVVIDLVILLDSSSSVNRRNFALVRDFVANFVRNITIGPAATQVGLVRYNRRIDDRWNLNTYNNMENLLEAIGNIPYKGRGTYTGAAIQYVVDNKFTAEMGRRPGVPAVALVITDGKSGDEVLAPSQNLHSFATVIAIGIKGADQVELNMIATPSKDNAFAHTLQDFNQLDDIINIVTDNFCQAPEMIPEVPTTIEPCPPHALLDVVILLDSSSSVGSENFAMMKEFIVNLTSSFNIGSDATQVGLVRYNRRIDDRWDLNTFNNLDDVLEAIESIPYDGRGTRTGAAIQFVFENKFTEVMGRRPGVPAVVLVITDGKSSDGVLIPARKLQSIATVVAVGIMGADVEELSMIETPHPTISFSHKVDDFGELGDVLDMVTERFCQAPSLIFNMPSNPGSCPPNAIIDLVILLDSSSSVGKKNFDFMRNFVDSLASTLNTGPEGTQIGLVRYNREIDDQWALNTHENINGVLDSIARIPYDGSGTYTGAAIRYLFENKFTQIEGRRPGVPAVALVVTDGKSADEILKPSRNLQEIATVIAIGIRGAVQGRVDQMASPHPTGSYSRMISDFDELDSIVMVVIQMLCELLK